MSLTCPIMTLYNEYFALKCLELWHFHQNHQKSSFCLTFKGACRRQFQSRKILYLIFFLFLSVIDLTHNKSALRLHKLSIQPISLCKPRVILLKYLYLRKKCFEINTIQSYFVFYFNKKEVNGILKVRFQRRRSRSSLFLFSCID